MTQSSHRGPLALVSSVTAVVVVDGRSDYLPKTLVSLSRQSFVPAQIVIVDVSVRGEAAIPSMAERCGLDPAKVVVLHQPNAANFGQAVFHARARIPGTPQWLWLLHDDSYPRPETLNLLVEAVESAPSVAIAGPKQHQAQAPEIFGEVGVTMTKFGRRTSGAEDGELDQGQYDYRDDVLSVGTAGMLIRTDVWDSLAGTDPALGPFDDGLDLGYRARLAGHRVVIVTAAVIDHEQASYRGLRAGVNSVGHSYFARRLAACHRRLVYANWAAMIFVALGLIVAGFGRALMRMATKDFGYIGPEIAAPFRAVLRPAAYLRARRSLKGTSVVGRGALAPLLATAAQVREQKRDRRMVAALEVQNQETPSELELSERALLRKRRRIGLALTTLGSLALALWGLHSILSTEGISGGALGRVDGGLSQLWSYVTGSWIFEGLGEAGPASPFSAVLFIASLLTFGHTNAAVLLLLLGSVILSGLGMWFASGAATRSASLRTLASLFWAAGVPLWMALSQGRLGAALAHAILPWLALAVGRALGLQRVDRIEREVPGEESDQARVSIPVATHGSWTAAAVASLLLAVLTACSPAAGLVVLVCLLVLFVFCRRRIRLVMVAVGAVIPLLPALIEVASGASWKILVVDPGLPLKFARGTTWMAWLGWPVDAGSVANLGGLPSALVMGSTGGALVVAAVLALLRRGPRARAVRLAWIVVLVAAGSVLLLSQIAADRGSNGGISPWPGAIVSLLQLSLMGACLIGGDRARDALAEASFGWRQLAAGLSSVLFLVSGVGAVATVWWAQKPGESLVRIDDPPTIPLIAAVSSSARERTSTLVVAANDSGVEWDVIRGAGPGMLDPAARLLTSGQRDAGDDRLNELAAALASGALEDPTELVTSAIGYVFVPTVSKDSAPTRRLVAALDSTRGLTRATSSSRGILWRVAIREAAAGKPGSAARVQVLDAKGNPREAVGITGTGTLSGNVKAAPQGSRLVLAERADRGWRASIGGHPLSSSREGWRQAFNLDGRSGRLLVWHESATWPYWVQGGVVLVLLVISLPLPSSNRRKESSWA